MKSYSLLVIGRIGHFVTESESDLLATYVSLTPVYHSVRTQKQTYS